MRKTLSALLCSFILILFIVPASCGRNAPDADTASDSTALAENTEAAETLDPSYTDDVPELDYGGYVFRIIGHGGENTNPAFDVIYDKEKAGDLVEDAKC